ncbi:stage V sporulation protein AA [Sediminibacillus dalangtanensis]|uniref:Stage V sporulation protein AA n=1 Tax=Sediminibacillus dalangtanensis TaxID=2729421 RepID=A0ABX7VT77_9BACI|nr:stage V sporulation protein AA [Sediminibacillus dalangtanensis]QTM99713.1 stage V sporulation protein AA [Sediminibacillus dalangtanensis]
MEGIVYLRLKKKLYVTEHTTVLLKDIAVLSGTAPDMQELGETHIYQVTPEDQNVSVIDIFTVIDKLTVLYPNLEFQQVGAAQTILMIEKKRKNVPILLVTLIWLLLFIGSAMAIMNFHYDVSMQEVQQRLHYLLTGENKEYPLWLQIPYSFGLGIGMILFFNHLFKKRFNEEPSPLEVEIYKYQQDLDSYVTYHENELNKEHGSHHSQ